MVLEFGLGEWKVEVCLNEGPISRAKWGKLMNPLFTKISQPPARPADETSAPFGAEVSSAGLAGGFSEKGPGGENHT